MDYYNSMLALIGLPGWSELLIAAFVGLLLFGRRLPEVARSMGQSIIEFKKGMQGVKQDIDNAGPGASDRPSQRIASSESSPHNSLPGASTADPARPAKHAVESGD
jgi:sec-independent protein translocase protein TatA